MEEFEALLQESFEIDTPNEGSVVKGKVIAIEAGQAIIDVGYKMEGRVELKEFANPGEAPEIAVGDEVEVFLDRVENSRGEAASAVTKPVAKKPGIVWKRHMPTKTASKALSLAVSKAASPSIWAALLPSCPARRLMCAPCAMLAP